MKPMLTRRSFGLALAAAPLSMAFAKIDSKIQGIQFGLQSYSFNGLPLEGILDVIVKSMVETGLGECEIWSPLIEPAEFSTRMRAPNATPEERAQARKSAVGFSNEVLERRVPVAHGGEVDVANAGNRLSAGEPSAQIDRAQRRKPPQTPDGEADQSTIHRVIQHHDGWNRGGDDQPPQQGFCGHPLWLVRLLTVISRARHRAGTRIRNTGQLLRHRGGSVVARPRIGRTRLPR